MSGKITKVQLPLLLLLTMTLIQALPAYAQPPPIPQEFRGNVTVNGNPAPQGAAVSVSISGTQVASTTTDAQGRYGYSSSLLVSSVPGSLVEFYVNGTKAQETATFESGKMITLNLTVGPGSSSLSPPATQTLAQTAPSAASFAVSNLNASPSSAKPSELVIVTADVKNGGGSEGTYKVVLKVNGATEVEQTIALSPGKTHKVTYTIIKEKPSDYSITIDNQSTSFKVIASEPLWITSQAWWTYLLIGMGVLLVMLFVILLISRRNASYF